MDAGAGSGSDSSDWSVGVSGGKVWAFEETVVAIEDDAVYVLVPVATKGRLSVLWGRNGFKK